MVKLLRLQIADIIGFCQRDGNVNHTFGFDFAAIFSSTSNLTKTISFGLDFALFINGRNLFVAGAPFQFLI